MITVLIPTCDAGPRFVKLLDKLREQALRPVQIIVIDSTSTDATCEIARIHNCRVITISRADFDHGTVRNLLLPDIKTEFVIYLTQDALPADADMIAELIKPMQADPNIAVCYGRQVPYPDADPLEMFAREFNYPAHSMLKTKSDLSKLGIKTFFCSNSCAAYRRSIFEKLGGFKDGVGTNEDMLFAAKAIMAGYGVYYAADAKVFHSHDRSIMEKFKRYFNIGKFFADNDWILKSAGLKNYGSTMLKTGIKTFWAKRMPQCILAMLAEFAVKACACTIGKYYQLLFHKKHGTYQG
ncbi:MAG: glycosyltransferase family 2 protein [Sedimentisphaerales bacterium]|nr:glycosyltransferase family 2 protein [Sedimentisphaerales bacterium]